MEFDFFECKDIDQDTLKSHMPGDIFEEVSNLPLLIFAATLKKNEDSSKEPIGYAFFLPENPIRLLWIKINEEYYGTALGHTLLEYAEDHIKSKGISGIFTSLWGDYFSTYRGNTFLNKNDFDVIKQNKRLIIYKSHQINTNPKIKTLYQIGEKLCARVNVLDYNNPKHQKFLSENVGDIHTGKEKYIDNTHSFVYVKENKVVGAAVSSLHGQSEIYVTDFLAAKENTAQEAAKGLLIMLLIKSFKDKGLSIITVNEAQRDLLIDMIGVPDRNLPYWEYYKGLSGRESDIDG